MCNVRNEYRQVKNFNLSSKNKQTNKKKKKKKKKKAKKKSQKKKNNKNNNNNVELKIEDIDRSHRLGKPGSEASPRSKPRDIIVKFATYRMRQKVYKSRTLTKERNYRRVFINEDLTILRSQLLYEARRRVKSKQLKSAWSSDGTILVKHIDDNGTVARVTCESDLPAYVPLPNEPGTRSTR